MTNYSTNFAIIFYNFLCKISVGGPGWTRTNGVSYVTDLQSATIATRLLTHISG